MGQPGGSHFPSPRAEHIGAAGATRGTETSKYPEEEKSNEIPLVVASERGGGQTGGCASAAGVAGPETWEERASGTAWEGRRDRVRAPYAKRAPTHPDPRVPPDT